MTTMSGQDGRGPLDPERQASGGYLVEPREDDEPTVILTPYGELPAYHGDVLPTGPVGGRRESRRARESESGGTPRRASGPRRTTPTPLGRAVLPLALALVCAVALVAGWNRMQDDRATATGAAQGPVTAPSGLGVVPSTAASHAASHAPSPSPTPTRTALAVDRSVPVVVLNATRRQGLAAHVAAQLRKDGWTVVAIGNYRRGGVTVTTVFARGHATAVATVRRDLPTRDPVRAPLAGFNAARITVVVGTDYPRT